MLVISIGSGWYWLKKDQAAHVKDEATGCLTESQPPEAILFLVDTTDRLSSANAMRAVQRIRDAAEKLPRYSRVVVVPFGNNTAAPLSPVFNKCLPGRGKEAGLNESARHVEEAYKVFNDSLTGLKEKLEALPDARTSPISEQIVRAASDPVLRWAGEKKTLVLISDGLETSIYWSRNLTLPDPKPRLLDGVQVEYFEIGNEKAGKLQSEQMRTQWKDWFEKAGASVRMTAPGYAA